MSLKYGEFGPVAHTLKNVFNSMKFADVSLICKDGKVLAHRSILSSASNLLRMLIDETGVGSHACCCSATVIMLPDVSVYTMKQFLQLIYTGRSYYVSSSDHENLCDVAKMLGFPKEVTDKNYKFFQRLYDDDLEEERQSDLEALQSKTNAQAKVNIQQKSASSSALSNIPVSSPALSNIAPSSLALTTLPAVSDSGSTDAVTRNTNNGFTESLKQSQSSLNKKQAKFTEDMNKPEFRKRFLNSTLGADLTSSSGSSNLAKRSKQSSPEQAPHSPLLDFKFDHDVNNPDEDLTQTETFGVLESETADQFLGISATPPSLSSYLHVNLDSEDDSEVLADPNDDSLLSSENVLTSEVDASFEETNDEQSTNSNQTKYPKIYQCVYCNKSYTTTHSLSRHVNAQHNNHVRYNCPVEDCGYLATRRDNLKRHVTTIHILGAGRRKGINLNTH